ncbi:MAG: metalloprotease [Symploca sp. SIO2D2]|nr:metalloprotease [Symploca sp. SIO2D2]
MLLRQLVSKHFAHLLVTTLTVAASTLKVNAQSELPPEVVINTVYKGIQFIHGSEAVPDLYFNGNSFNSSCGLTTGSAYCPADHVIFIPTRDINWAYQHGDAALAYIVAHEYAHAMQTAGDFLPSITLITELQADCIAGLYLGVIPNIVFDTSDMLEIGSFAHRIGQPDTWHDNHRTHGTPKQRMKAVADGMDASSEGMQGVRVCLNKYSTPGN